MKLANEDVSMLAFTSEQITAPFLLPEMVISLSLSILCYLMEGFQWIISNVLPKLHFSPLNLLMWYHFSKVERVASMLNYFLLQLVGPQRKSLSLKDPEKYEFRPKHLLKQVGIIIFQAFLVLLFS